MAFIFTFMKGNGIVLTEYYDEKDGIQLKKNQTLYRKKKEKKREGECILYTYVHRAEVSVLMQTMIAV